MLTLKAPIQLHTAQGLAIGTAEAFGERIRGNYELMNARFTPRDLLFLMTAPSELPEDLGGMTTLVSQQSRVDIRSVTLDVVNNVVNRILLDGTNQFTYQDQVYITSVLNRLGITNVEQFMSQVRQLRLENESTYQLTRLYRAELERILQQQAAGESVPQLPIRSEKREEEEVAHQDPRVTMSMEILQRLETSNLYETIHAFQRNWAQAENHFHRNELRMSEQLRFSNAVSLAEIKQQIFHHPQVQLMHHLNQYETGVLLEAPKNEEAVLSQAAVAALVTAVDNTVTQVLNRPQFQQEQWVRLENALWQTAENTLSRFESYHSYDQIPTAEGRVTQETNWNQYVQELLEYQSFHQQVHPRMAEQGHRPGLPSQTNLQMTHLTQVEEDTTLLLESLSNLQIGREQYRTMLREVLEGPLMRSEQIPKPSDRQREILRERVRQETERLRELQKQQTTFVQGQNLELTEILPQVVQTVEPPPAPSVQPMVLTPKEAEEQAPEILVEEISRIDQQNRMLMQTVQQDILRREVTPPAGPDFKRTMQDALRALEEPETVLREIYSADEKAQTVYLSLTPQEEALMRQADPASKALYERVLAYQKDPEAALAQGLVQPGSMGTLHAEIQRVIAETEAAQEPEKAPTIHLEMNSQETPFQAAEQADTEVYQKDLATRGGPEGALARAILQGEPGALQGIIRQTTENDPAILEHRETLRETEQLREETEVVLEQFRHLPQQRRTVEQPRNRHEAVKIVHKQAPPDVTEELLEQLEQQRTQQTVKTESSEEIRQQHVRQMDVTQVERQVVTQTTEDITELVNRTLARQMRTISDQVYRQMEKRLQTERSRRGRF